MGGSWSEVKWSKVNCCWIKGRTLYFTLNNCSCDCCIFILCTVFNVCVVLYNVFRLIVVLYCVTCVLCPIVVPLPPRGNIFAAKIKNNNICKPSNFRKSVRKVKYKKLRGSSSKWSKVNCGWNYGRTYDITYFITVTV
jgi:hypothetical protein